MGPALNITVAMSTILAQNAPVAIYLAVWLRQEPHREFKMLPKPSMPGFNWWAPGKEKDRECKG